MSSYTTSSAASPFTRAVVSSMRKLYPEPLADKSFDNTGLLLEAPFDPLRRQMNSVLLTVDLTRAVAAEAIENKHCCVVAYHPIIFRGLKSLTLANSQQSSLLRLALEGISVYCPHTAVDAVPDGMADWLCDIVTGTSREPQPEQKTGSSNEKAMPAQTSNAPEQGEQNSVDGQSDPKSNAKEDGSSNKQSPPIAAKATANRPQMNRSYSKPIYTGSKTSNSNPTPFEPSHLPHTRSVIHPSPDSSISLTHNPSSFPSDRTGSGRLITFQEPQPLTHLIEHIASGTGNPKGFPVAIPQSCQVEDITIKTVGICPGSGAGVLKDCGADLIFTGELSHHDALAVTERGGSVVTLFHSNSERGYLHSVLKGKLLDELKAQWAQVREDYLAAKFMPVSAAGTGTETAEDKSVHGGESDGAVSEELQDALADQAVQVAVSTVDRDPYGIVVLQGTEVEGMKI